MEPLKKITNLDNFVEWCESKRHLCKKGQYKSDFKRIYCTFGYGVTLDKPPKFIKSNEDDRLNAIASSVCPQWKLSLLCFYERGGGIRPHRDTTGYGSTGYCLSSTNYIFIHDGNQYECQAGTIYSFTTKVLHSVPALPSSRWALLWWEPDWRWWNAYWENQQQLSLF